MIAAACRRCRAVAAFSSFPLYSIKAVASQASANRAAINAMVTSSYRPPVAYPWAAKLRRMSSTLSMRSSATTVAASSSAAEASTADGSTTESLLGIDWIRDCVAKVLNEGFDPAKVARGAAMAKLDGGKKKKKKKNKKKGGNDDDSTDAKRKEEPTMSEEERQRIIDAAIAAAKPFSAADAAVTAATKPEFGDYQCNAAMALAKKVGMSPRDCALKIVEGIKPLITDIMEEPEIAGPGFINFSFKEDYLAKAVKSMAEDAAAGGRLAVPPAA